jgi:hypothetical protein
MFKGITGRVAAEWQVRRSVIGDTDADTPNRPEA